MNYHDITYPDMNNGDGLRVVLWLSGCSHHCKNCQNPQTWDEKSGIPFDKDAIDELLKELSRDYISGMTLSGGDPLYKGNLIDVALLVLLVRQEFPNKNIWVYTGYKWEDIWLTYDEWENAWVTRDRHSARRDLPDYACISLMQYIVSQCDVLVDGEYIDEQRDVTLPWRGSSNQRVIDVKKSLKNKDKKIVLYEV